MAKQEPVAVSGIWLRSRGTYMEVLVERDGEWYVVIEEYGNSISHIVEPLGILKGKPDPIRPNGERRQSEVGATA
jgi:hypothetical protein